jgi:hypothetical protein
VPGCCLTRLRMEENMRPTTANDDNVFDFQALLHPGTVFEHPKDVVGHPSLTLAEKQAILVSWGRFGNCLMSRVAGSGSTEGALSIDAILEALCEPEGGPRNPGSSGRHCCRLLLFRGFLRDHPPGGLQLDVLVLEIRHHFQFGLFTNYPFRAGELRAVLACVCGIRRNCLP